MRRFHHPLDPALLPRVRVLIHRWLVSPRRPLGRLVSCVCVAKCPRRFEGNSAYAPLVGWPKFYLSTSACPNWCPTTRGKLRKPALPLQGSIPLSAGALPVTFPAWVVQDNTSPLMVLDDAPLAEHTEILQSITQAVSVKRLPKILESSNLWMLQKSQ